MIPVVSGQTYHDVVITAVRTKVQRECSWVAISSAHTHQHSTSWWKFVKEGRKSQDSRDATSSIFGLGISSYKIIIAYRTSDFPPSSSNCLSNIFLLLTITVLNIGKVVKIWYRICFYCCNEAIFLAKRGYINGKEQGCKTSNLDNANAKPTFG